MSFAQVPHYPTQPDLKPRVNQIGGGSGVQASGSGPGAMRTIGNNVASTMTSQGWDGAATRSALLVVGGVAAVKAYKRRGKGGNASSNDSLAAIGGMTIPSLSSSGSSAW